MAYKLFYFNIRGLAEPIRFLLSYGNVQFEDIRVQNEEWAKLKPSMPFGQMPVLEIDGKKIHQHLSICRYLAKKIGIDGKTDFENFEIDSLADTVNDFRSKIAAVHYEADPKIQEEKRKTLNAEVIPYYLEKLEEIAKENNGHLALKRLTWADVLFTSLIDSLNFMSKQDLTANYPNLKKLTTNVLAIDGVKNYLAKRPNTEASEIIFLNKFR